jgi:tRNA threonylcarbamoyladenosine biosynthesis protein TsaB
MLLALDTSTHLASLALAAPERLVAELTWEVGQRHSAELFDRVRWLLSSAGTEPQALTGIAVATGPGSFNGLRVALTTAKTLAFALGVPLYGHATLDVIGWGHAACGTPVWALLEAGRGQVYAARYQPAEGALGWGPSGGQDGYRILTPAELARLARGTVTCAGEVRPQTRVLLATALGERLRFARPLAARRASWLAELALARAAVGAADDPLQLEPLYLRKPAITQSTKTAQAVRAASEEATTRVAQAAPRGDPPAPRGAPSGEGVRRAIRR